jgi:hypothetical protein
LPDTFHAERGLSLPMGLDNSSYLRIRPHRMNARQSHRQHSDAEECAKDGICFQPSVEFALTFRRQRLIFPPGAHASLPFARSREFSVRAPCIVLMSFVIGVVSSVSNSRCRVGVIEQASPAPTARLLGKDY